MIEYYDRDEDGYLSMEELELMLVPVEVDCRQVLIKRQPANYNKFEQFNLGTQALIKDLLLNILNLQISLEDLRQELDQSDLKDFYRLLDAKNKGRAGIR